MKKLVLILVALFAFVGCGVFDSSPTEPKPVALFSFSALPGNVVSFSNGSTGASHFLWDFGDATGGLKDSDPVHIYAVQGEYLVRLTACSTDDFSNEARCDTSSAVVVTED